jgi:hypothetical protein
MNGMHGAIIDGMGEVHVMMMTIATTAVAA